MTPTTLIIDDDPAYAASLARLVEHAGFRAELAYSGEEGLEEINALQPELAIVDMALPGIDGVEVLRKLREREPKTVCLGISGHATVENVVAAMQAGAFDFITKASPFEEIELKLRKALEVAELRRSVEYLREQEQRAHAAEMVGQSVPMQRVYNQVREIAATRGTTVLILGETGTGKELVARAIHTQSERRNHPLVAVNCTAMPDQLMESEFFGHERGAFTGADRSKKGLLELADGGTLFLDEIGDLELGLQGKLLRAIEERRLRRVGGVRDIEVNVRFIAATNRDLEAMAAEGRFRSDLLYRLNVFQIVLPPLRERGEDVVLLARHFIAQLNAQLGKEVKGLAPDAEALLRAHPFPGNVRQLRNLIEQAMILVRGPEIGADLIRSANGSHVPPAPRPAGASDQSVGLAQALAQIEQQEQALIREELRVVESALEQARGNKTHAAALLGISRYALQRRLRRLRPDPSP